MTALIELYDPRDYRVALLWPHPTAGPYPEPSGLDGTPKRHKLLQRERSSAQTRMSGAKAEIEMLKWYHDFCIDSMP